jgi:Na+/H+ antiporter NhaD/arsenite permease-like protein
MGYTPVQPSLISIVPFVALVVTIAIAPQLLPKWWAAHYSKLCGGLGVIVVVYYLVVLHAPGNVLLQAREFLGFIAVVGSLYVVAGGIHIHVKGEASPAVNTVFLAVGALLANVLGTTGASILLIRPWIRMNKYRITGHHIAFFIFLVSNVGGFLTPVGPPLLLGYLHENVPFWWVASQGWRVWLLAVGLLLVIFYFVDLKNFRLAPKDVREKETTREQWRFDGCGNLFFLAVIFGAVFIEKPPLLREFVMICAAAGSYFATRKPVHQANHFTFGPAKEVAILFAGIFATMLPASDWLAANASKIFGNAPPAAYYFGSGVLSSVLDNAPTYQSFVSALYGVTGTRDMSSVLTTHTQFMLAISVGSVFFGANTYIGNGPNLLVKAITDEQHLHTPGFLAYIFRYALPFMAPTLIIVWLIFFRG